MGRKIKVGSRESLLAVKQAEIVMAAIKLDNPKLETELITFKTKGDIILDQSLDKIGGKGLFVKELEHALLNGDIDIAVHSYKDMPYVINDNLPIVALSERESPFDALVLPGGESEIDFSKPVGSSSSRRNIQLQEIYSKARCESIRGNVITRLKKLDSGGYSAIILAVAGLNRLSLQNRITRVFTPDEMIPSASQGILAVQGRKGGDYSYLEGFRSKESEYASYAERQFLLTLGGDCSSPVAAYCRASGNELILMGMYVNDSGLMAKGSIRGDIKSARALGEKLALELMEKAVV